MARPAGTSKTETSQDEPAEFEAGEDDEIEYEEKQPPQPKYARRILRNYIAPWGGAVLVGWLGWTIWSLQDGRHATPSTRAASELSLTRDRIREGPRNTRGASSPNRLMSAGAPLPADNDPHEPTGDSSSALFQGTEPIASDLRQMEPAAEPGVHADELRLLQQRFDRLGTSLQTLQGVMQPVLTEMRSSRAFGRAQEALDSADKMLSVLKKQLASRDQEIARLRGELAAREHLVKDMKLQAQRSDERSALAGWEIVGLTARNAALKDPSGQTHVVSVGETIVDGVKLKQIDPAGTRITTSVGEMVYHGAR